MTVGDLWQAATNAHRTGRLAEAEPHYRALLAQAPGHADASHLFGLLLAQTNRAAEAEPLLRHAAAVTGRPDVLNNLAEFLRQTDRLDESEALFRRAMALAPQFPEVHYNLANVVKQRFRHNEAIELYRRAIALRPNYAQAWYNLGNTLREEGRTVTAADAYRQALAIQPDWPDAHLNYANVLCDLKEHDAAAEQYRLAARSKPDDPDLSDSLGHVYLAQGQIPEAADCYRKALSHRPERWWRELRIAALGPIVPPSGEAIDEYRDRVSRAIDQFADRNLRLELASLHSAGCEPPMLLTYHGRDELPLKRRFAELYAPAMPPADLPRPGEGKPRVGIVVTHGHEGVFARCLGELAARLDRTKLDVRIVCPRSSANVLRHMLPAAGFEFVYTADRIDETAKQLRAERFDLLHYWEIGTDSTNYFLPFLRPAPVQTTTWGWPSTAGHATIDAYISAADLEPPDGEEHYAERLVRLKHLPTYYVRPPVPSRKIDPGHFGIEADQHLYLIQQNVRKYHPDFDPMLAGILRADPAGRIGVIADEQPRITDALMTRLRGAMPDVTDRLVVIGRLEREDYLGLVAAADAVLDTPHYGGGANTVYDAAAASAPLVTRPGAYHRGRWAAAVNARLGVPELNAESADDFVRQAVRLATDPEWRRQIVGQIVANAPGLFADTNPVRELEDCFLQIIGRS